MKRITVLLADDHAMVREGLAQLLQESSDIHIVGQAGDGPTTLTQALQLRPDVVVLDYTMPESDCAVTIQKIRAQCPKTNILVLTVHENIHYAIKSLGAGARGFVHKAAAVDELVRGIRTISTGRNYTSPSISEGLTEHFRSGKSQKTGLDSLSSREFQLLRLMSTGMTLGDCARTMNIGNSTASTYRSRLMEKLGLKTTADIIRFALENDIHG